MPYSLCLNQVTPLFPSWHPSSHQLAPALNPQLTASSSACQAPFQKREYLSVNAVLDSLCVPYSVTSNPQFLTSSNSLFSKKGFLHLNTLSDSSIAKQPEKLKCCVSETDDALCPVLPSFVDQSDKLVTIWTSKQANQTEIQKCIETYMIVFCFLLEGDDVRVILNLTIISHETTRRK